MTVPVPGSAGPLTLREPANTVSPRARAMWLCTAVVWLLVLAAAQLLWWVADGSDSGTRHLVVALLTGVAGTAYALVMPVWRYQVHRWEATPTAVYTQTGWVVQERRIAPISRIQTVDMQRGPLAQLFRLATVRVTTASAAGPLHIEGLDHTHARHLVEELTAITVAVPGDAT